MSDSPLGGIPEGELYALFMAADIGLGTFRLVIDTLVASGLVTNENHLLKVTAKR